METIGERILFAMQRARLKRSDVSKAVGVSGGAVGHWVTGTSYPSHRHLEALAGALRVTPSWLLNGGDLSESRTDEEVLIEMYRKASAAGRALIFECAAKVSHSDA